MTESHHFYVYLYRDPMTHIPFYVGKGYGRRVNGPHSHWCGNKIASLAKKGLKPEVIIYAEHLLERHAFFLERMLVERYGRRDLGTGCLCNLRDGGEGAYNPSRETRHKMSVAQKGRKKSPEAIRKTALANTGKKRSKECRLNMSKSAKTRPPISEETRRKLSIANKGKTISHEQRRQASERLKGKRPSEQCMKKCAAANIGRKRSAEEIERGRHDQTEETRKKISKTLKGRKKPDGFGKVQSGRLKGVRPSDLCIQRGIEARKGKRQSEEQINKRVAKLIGHETSEETRRRISEGLKKHYASLKRRVA